MDKPKSALPSVFPAILAFAVILGVGYFFYSDLKPSSRTEHTLTPPIEIVEPEPAVTIIEAEPAIQQGKEIIEQEATEFVAQLAAQDVNHQDAIILNEDNQGSFIRYDGKVLLPKLEHRDTSINTLLADENLDNTTKINLEFIEQTTSSTTLYQLKSQVEDQMAAITIQRPDGQQITAPLAEIIAQQQIPLDEKITLIETTTRHIDTTFGQLHTVDIDQQTRIKATINRGEQALSLNNIIQQQDSIPDNAIFYLHRVTENDHQGLWGIIQAGLIKTFRQGISLKGMARNKELVQVTIPQDADEKLPNGLSSFLGKLLSSKVDSTYIYNYKTEAMGFDPNVIHPGQQLILIQFNEQELKDIYQFFSEQRNSNTQVYAVPF
jgi:hypothetical protein